MKRLSRGIDLTPTLSYRGEGENVTQSSRFEKGKRKKAKVTQSSVFEKGIDLTPTLSYRGEGDNVTQSSVFENRKQGCLRYM